MKEKIKNILQIPLISEGDVILPPCFTCQILFDNGLKGDGMEQINTVVYQINIFADTESEVKKLVGVLKKNLTVCEAMGNPLYSYERNAKCNRCVFNLEMIEEDE